MAAAIGPPTTPDTAVAVRTVAVLYVRSVVLGGTQKERERKQNKEESCHLGALSITQTIKQIIPSMEPLPLTCRIETA